MPAPPISKAELMPIDANLFAASESVADNPQMRPLPGPLEPSFPDDFILLQRLHVSDDDQAALGAVSMTFTRRVSAKKPTLPFMFAREYTRTRSLLAALETIDGGNLDRLHRRRISQLADQTLGSRCPRRILDRSRLGTIRRHDADVSWKHFVLSGELLHDVHHALNFGGVGLRRAAGAASPFNADG